MNGKQSAEYLIQRAQRVKELEAEVERYAKQVAQLDELRHEAEQDAMRYRWLRDRRDLGNGEPFICICFGSTFSGWFSEHADKQIDAAMGEKP